MKVRARRYTIEMDDADIFFFFLAQLSFPLAMVEWFLEAASVSCPGNDSVCQRVNIDHHKVLTMSISLQDSKLVPITELETSHLHQECLTDRVT